MKKLLPESELDKAMLKELAETKWCPRIAAAGPVVKLIQKRLRGIITQSVPGGGSAPLDTVADPKHHQAQRRPNYASTCGVSRGGTPDRIWRKAHTVVRREGLAVNPKRTRRV